MKKWGVGAAALGAFAVGGYFALSSYARTEAQARVAQAAGQIRRHVKQLDYAAVDVAPLSQAVEVRDVRLDDGRGRLFHIGAIRFEHFDWIARDMPRYGDICVTGLRISLDAAAAPSMKNYGYDQVEAQARFGYAFDDAAETLDIRLHIEATDAGVLTFKTKLASLSPEVLMTIAQGMDNPLAFSFAVLAVSLAEASAEFEDHSLVGRTLGGEAQRRGVNPDQVRNELINILAGPDPQMAQTAKSLRDFLERPGRIKISVAPHPPVSGAETIRSLTSDRTPPQAFLSKRLNFRATAE